MSQVELIAAARKHSISIPPSMQGLKGVARPSHQDLMDRDQLIRTLNSFYVKRSVNWSRLAVWISIASLVVSGLAILLTVTY